MITFLKIFFRGVAQPGSAPALGAGCRGFKSLPPDQMSIYFCIISSGEEETEFLSVFYWKTFVLRQGSYQTSLGSNPNREPTLDHKTISNLLVRILP